jgi:hypothetical protein
MFPEENQELGVALMFTINLMQKLKQKYLPYMKK